MRPGEKLTEELRAPDEEAFTTPHPSIVRLHPRVAEYAELQACIDDLAEFVAHRQESRVVDVLLAASNEPTALRSIVVRNRMRHAGGDIDVIDTDPVVLTEYGPRREGPDLRDRVASVIDLEWSTPWAQPNT
jgi:hypothetical protein